MLPERESISIAEIAIYFPFLLAALFVARKHGFKRGSGFLYLVIFSILRIAGAIMTILSIHHPSSTTDVVWGAILGSIGLSPLMLAAFGLLNRINEFLASGKPLIIASHILHIPTILALILAIIGGTRISSSDVSKHPSGQNFEKAGGVMFLIVYIALVVLVLLTMIHYSQLPWGEKRILLAIMAALPLLAVRILYSLLADFKHDSTFNIVDGNATVQLCMSIIEEMIVMVLFLVAGITAPDIRGVEPGPQGNQILMNGAKAGGV